MTSTPTPQTSPSPRVPMVIVVLLAVASVLTTLLVVLTVVKQRMDAAVAADTPAVLFDVPLFQLTERSGADVQTADLRGKVWIANFVFTRCPGICPAMTAAMASLQRELRTHPRWDDLRLVSFSVDPEHDTPQVLTDYAADYRADETHWLFLTGEREPIWRMITDGFRLVVQEQDNPAMPILHSDKFVLVDATGRIRGYYSGLDAEDLEQLKRDLDIVLREPIAAPLARN